MQVDLWIDPLRVSRRPVAHVTVPSVQASFDIEGKERPSLCDLVVVGVGHLCPDVEVFYLGRAWLRKTRRPLLLAGRSAARSDRRAANRHAWARARQTRNV